MALFLGIDAGGSKTSCALADEHKILARSSGLSAKIQRVGRAEAARNLVNAVQACVAKAHGANIDAICMGVSGLSQPDVEDFLRGVLTPLGAKRVVLVGDHIIAYEAAFEGGAGIMVISGTGSIAFGRNQSGETARAGGHGTVISDEGSGYWIGRAALASLVRAQEMGRETTLKNVIFKAWAVNSIDEAVAKANSNPPPDFAALAPAVIAAGHEGDGFASDIVSSAAIELARLAATVRQRLWKTDESVTVCGTGGVLDNSLQLQLRLGLELSTMGMEWDDRPVEAVLGAVHLARTAT